MTEVARLLGFSLPLDPLGSAPSAQRSVATFAGEDFRHFAAGKLGNVLPKGVGGSKYLPQQGPEPLPSFRQLFKGLAIGDGRGRRGSASLDACDPEPLTRNTWIFAGSAIGIWRKIGDGRNSSAHRCFVPGGI